MVRNTVIAIVACIGMLAVTLPVHAEKKIVSAGEWECSGPWSRKTVTNADDGKKYNCDCQKCSRSVCVEDAGQIRCGGTETASCRDPRNCTAAKVSVMPGETFDGKLDGVLDPGKPATRPKVFQKVPGVLVAP